MTHIRDSRRVKRAVTTHRHQELVVILAPEGIYLREPRRRTSYLLPYGTAFQKAAQLKADYDYAVKQAVARERRKARKRA